MVLLKYIARSALVLVLGIAIAHKARSQCNVASVVTIGTVNCSGFDVVVQFFGTPTMTSYAYAISTDDSSVYLSGGTNSSGYTYHVPWTNDPVVTAVNVTAFDDPTACQSIGAWTGTLNRPVMDLQYSLTLDCSTGLRALRWTNANIACGSAGSHTYTVDGSTGTVASGFTQESAAVWRYNTLLAAGTHTFGIDATPTAYPGYNCGSFTQCWALSTTGLITFVAQSVTPGDCGTNFNLRAFLDGCYVSGTLMSDGLRPAGLIPTTEPYTALGYAYTGSPSGLTIAPTVLSTTGANAIVDWMVVELRSAASPATVVYSRPVLVQRDGDVVDTDGSVYINVPVAAGSYYVALRHRNHLAVMMAAAIPLSVDPMNTTIDFRSQLQAAYGTNARVLKSGNYCLWAGDVTGDGTIRYIGANNDRDPILVAIGGSSPNNTVSNVYSPLDVNMNGVISYVGANNDRDPILTTVGGSTPTNTRVQQLP